MSANRKSFKIKNIVKFIRVERIDRKSYLIWYLYNKTKKALLKEIKLLFKTYIIHQSKIFNKCTFNLVSI